LAAAISRCNGCARTVRIIRDGLVGTVPQRSIDKLDAVRQAGIELKVTLQDFQVQFIELEGIDSSRCADAIGEVKSRVSPTCSTVQDYVARFRANRVPVSVLLKQKSVEYVQWMSVKGKGPVCPGHLIQIPAPLRREASRSVLSEELAVDR